VGSLRPYWQAIVALTAAVVLWLAQSAGALPWPSPAGPTLAGLLALVALTRITGDLGIGLQRRLRFAVAGVAIAAGSWFAGMSVLAGRRELLLLGGLHIAAAWLAAYGEPDDAERRRGVTILVASMMTLSVLALAAPNGSALGFTIAGVATTGILMLARARPIGLALSAVAAGAALCFGALRIVEWYSTPLGTAGTDVYTPMVVGTAAIGAIALLVGVALVTPKAIRELTPNVPQRTRSLLITAAVPASVVFGAAAILPFA